MNAELRGVLVKVMAYAGPKIYADPRRLEALLRDLAPEELREVAVLVEAAERGCVHTLASSHHDGRALNQLARDLSEQSAVAMRWAIWALECWQSVLEPQDGLSPQSATHSSQITDRPGTLFQVLTASTTRVSEGPRP
ncbi:MAG: hypothetical protein ACI9VR_001859 [Cognaticolwellia sp.]|jgi:hypothetical protein